METKRYLLTSPTSGKSPTKATRYHTHADCVAGYEATEASFELLARYGVTQKCKRCARREIANAIAAYEQEAIDRDDMENPQGIWP